MLGQTNEIVLEHTGCIVCGSSKCVEIFKQKDLLFKISDNEFGIVRCCDCRFIYLNPRPVREAIGTFYKRAVGDGEKVGGGKCSGVTKERNFSKTRLRILRTFYGYPGDEELLVSGLRRFWCGLEYARRTLVGWKPLPWVGEGRLLDVGCGPGVNLISLKRQGWNVYGIDFDEDAVSTARSRVGNCVEVGDLLDRKYPEKAFDVILFSHSLEHLYDPVATLREARRVLKDDGLIRVTVPNAGSLEAKIFGKWWHNWDPPRHLYHFSRQSLGKIMNRAGFQVISTYTGYGSVFFLASLEIVCQQVMGLSSIPLQGLAKMIANPFCIVLGSLGIGSEITMDSRKMP